MKSALAKMFLLALPLAGVLMTAPAADAHWQHYHHHYRPHAERGWYYRNERYNYPSRYPYRRYFDNGYPWWSASSNR